MLNDNTRRKIAALKRRNLVNAYRRIDERGMERFNPEVFRRLYKAAFDYELSEESLDEHMVSYSMYRNVEPADALTMRGYIAYREWLEVNWGG